jgi:NADH dehydrogenase
MERIAVTGANSALGRALIRLARERGERPELVLCVRSARAQAELGAAGPRERAARVDFADPESLLRAFQGAEAVLHLPGILIERRGSSYEQAHVQTTSAALHAAAKTGVRKLVLVSALGADARAHNRYYRTKGEAEALVRSAPLAHTILRAPLVLGPHTEGAAALRRRVARRRATLPGGGRHLQQPIDVRDLAHAALRAAEPGVAEDATLEVVGPESLPERELLLRAARLRGVELQVRSVPLWALRAALRLRGPFAAGFSADALQVITDDQRRDPGPAARALGLELTPLDAMLARSLEAAP